MGICGEKKKVLSYLSISIKIPTALYKFDVLDKHYL